MFVCLFCFALISVMCSSLWLNYQLSKVGKYPHFPGGLREEVHRIALLLGSFLGALLDNEYATLQSIISRHDRVMGPTRSTEHLHILIQYMTNLPHHNSRGRYI